MTVINLNKRKLFTTTRTDDITVEMIEDAIKLHRENLLEEYVDNDDMYLSDHDILHEDPKEAYKPDNRLVFNYPKYIVDSFIGYHVGNSVSITHSEVRINDYISSFSQLNNLDDKINELDKIANICGNAFLYVYQGEDKLTYIKELSPINTILIHDDSIDERPYFAIRYNLDDKGEIASGELITENDLQAFSKGKQGIVLSEAVQHPYTYLPVVEYTPNTERQSLFMPVKSLINELNKAISEKANDIDYFADAYLWISGMELEDGDEDVIKTNRVINTFGGENYLVQFLEKPNADTAQENLIKHLKEAIFNISMVANLNEENLGSASGTAMAFKLQNMNNLAKNQDRKLQATLSNLFKVVFSLPTTEVANTDFVGINYNFTRNIPRNLLEESQVINNLDGHVSDETKLSTLSIVRNAKDEMTRMDDEKMEDARTYQRLEQEQRGASDMDIFETNEKVIE
ncbi:phage portal protein [Aerococcus urinaeequi]|uniref:phage portal protein n=1 Tax=Aerococcus urinaeequi TaxID=51665 RepID=UPI00227E8AB0|nr:phage portal protein [Aerococcus urinaeequi]MCY7731793.1 phage portal protein [Aerococcus urinaeequi]